MPKKGAILRTATDSYIVGAKLGGGGAGEVFSVLDSTGNQFAAKILRAGLSTQKLKRFQNELMFGIREDHPHLIKVLDFGRSDEDEPFYVMPLASGTLRTMMKSGIEASRCLPLFSEILDGIEAAHLKGVIHRDLKPENILFYSVPPHLRIADFGVAHFEEEHLHTAIETLPSDRLANFEYAAPEQRRPGASIDFRADIFALGLMLAELFTGEVPHAIGALAIADRTPDFAYVDKLIEKMRQQDPSARPQSIRAVKQELMAHQNAFIETQKVDRLRGVVVKESEVTDELVSEPPVLTNVVFTGEGLTFELSKRVNPNWVQIFQNMPIGGLVGYGPEYHTFFGNTAQVRVPDRLAQRVVDQFKFYLTQANELYARTVAEAERDRVKKERSRLASEIERSEALARVQSNLRW